MDYSFCFLSLLLGIVYISIKRKSRQTLREGVSARTRVRNYLTRDKFGADIGLKASQKLSKVILSYSL